MNTAASWDSPAYRRIVSASHRGSKLLIQFEDGAWETVDAERVLPLGTRNPDWAALTFDSQEIAVPTQEGEVDIPWSMIRALTDKDFAAHLADVAAEQARQIGLRIRELREQRELSSKELAERAGITPQSLSRIEHGHHDVVFTTLQRILVAMGCSLKDLVVDPPKPASLGTVLRRLEKVGIDSEFACRRLIAECPPSVGREDQKLDDDRLVGKLASVVSHIYDWSIPAVLGSGPITLDRSVVGAARFKAPRRKDEQRAAAYAIYAHYLAGVVVDALPPSRPRGIECQAASLRQAVITQRGEFNFENLLAYAWDAGVPVVPLKDSGGFHGACWRLAKGDVIVLKQVTDSRARWLFDLSHELKHVMSHLSDDRPTIIEHEEISPIPLLVQSDPISQEEAEATHFADKLVLSGRAEELAEEAVKAANGSVERLKRAAQQVAQKEGVPVDVLANYLAFRLSLQGINWWGVATALQPPDSSPWQTARDMLLERIDPGRLTSRDRELLMLAMDG